MCVCVYTITVLWILSNFKSHHFPKSLHERLSCELLLPLSYRTKTNLATALGKCLFQLNYLFTQNQFDEQKQNEAESLKAEVTLKELSKFLTLFLNRMQQNVEESLKVRL